MNHKDYQEILEHLFERIDLLEKQLSTSRKAPKDYDGDGKVESGKAEYFGSKDKAIKKAIAQRKQNVQEALDRVGGNSNTNSPGLRCMKNFIQKDSPIVEQTAINLSKKNGYDQSTLRDDGARIQLSESVVFGGFPTIKKKAN